MKFTLATIIAVAAILVDAQEMGPPPEGGPHHRPDFGKDLVCPSPGGVATINRPACPTGPPPSHSHPHARPTGVEPSGHPHPHHGGHGHDGTKTVYPAGAPTVTSARNPTVDCKGCANVVFEGPTCSFPHHSHGAEGSHSHTHSHPEPTATVTGATKTKWEHGTPVCGTPSAALLKAGGESFAAAPVVATAV